MGLNSYETYNKKWVDQTTDRLNETQTTQAEKTLRQDTLALENTMNPMPGVMQQEIGRMEIETGEARKLTRAVRTLVRQHPDRPGLALDLGTFTGHSAGALALGMKEFGGKVLTCDFVNSTDANDVAIKQKYAAIANKYAEGEDVANMIEMHSEGADAMLDKLIADPSNWGKFDMLFIDHAKPMYKEDLKKAWVLLRPGAQVYMDNTGWSGRNTDEYRKHREEMHAVSGETPISKAIRDPKTGSLTVVYSAPDPSGDAMFDLNEEISRKTFGQDGEVKTAWQTELKKELKEDGYDFEFDNSCDGITIMEKGGFAKMIRMEDRKKEFLGRTA